MFIDNLRFVKELNPSTINTIEGQEKELAFECETSKSSPVQWFHDEQKLSPQELTKHYQIESLKSNTVHRLRILQPVTADSGLYRCVLPNNAETNAQCSIEQAGVDFLQQLTTPVHVEYMKSALLECELSKRPQSVVWKDKNGQIIEDSDKYEIMNNGKLQGTCRRDEKALEIRSVHREKGGRERGRESKGTTLLFSLGKIGLMINDCDEDDQGQYTITIDEKKSSVAEVIVEPKEEKVRSPTPQLESQAAEATAFRRLLPNELKADEDTEFMLECELADASQATDWYLNGKLIEPTNPRFKMINNGAVRQLKGKFLSPSRFASR